MAKAQFITQPSNDSCVATALINCLRFRDRPIKRARACALYLDRTIRRQRPRGIYRHEYIPRLERLGCRRIWRPCLSRIDKALLRGNAVVIETSYPTIKGRLGCHLFLISRRTEKSFYAVNLEGRHAWHPKSTFRRRWLRKLNGSPAIWELPSSPPHEKAKKAKP